MELYENKLVNWRDICQRYQWVLNGHL